MQTTVHIASFEEWRDTARFLLAKGIAPHDVQWRTPTQHADLFAQADGAQLGTAAESTDAFTVDSTADAASKSITHSDSQAGDGKSGMRLPRKLIDQLQDAACYRAEDRWAFLYRIVWRYLHGDHEVMTPADPDGGRLNAMVKAVHHEQHDMHAYLRFRERPDSAGAPRFVAWFEPAHDVLPQVARHFAARMGKISFMIATPDASVLWDGKELHFTGQLMQGPEDIEDAGETLWLSYYRSIFNPARLNTKIMQSHIPLRFWKNLPEGSQVPSMVAEAANGARSIGQVSAVGRRGGSAVEVSATRAQPKRDAPDVLDQCRRCDLWRNATQAVGGQGPKHARIMLVGEQPGDQEDLAGEPFVGPAGQVLERAFAQAGVAREKVYLTNAVKHFKWEPRGKRRLHKTPAQQEVDACHYWLDEELAKVKPKVIVALGSTALKSIMQSKSVTLTKFIGKPFEHEGRWIVVVYHPSYVLRVPDENARHAAMQVMVEGLKKAQELAGS